MKRVTRNGVIAIAAASGAMAVTMPAHADSAAAGSTADSPGLISGSTIQLPVHVPVNVCGNTVNVAGLLNPAAGSQCASAGGAHAGGAGAGGADAGNGGAASSGGASAEGGGKDSPGVLSGIGIQLPVDLPVNVSGNTVNLVGIGNPVVGNQSVNTTGDHPGKPTPRPSATPPAPPRAQPPTPQTARLVPSADATLARTGADVTAPAVAASAALLLSGCFLYRRYRPGAAR